MFDDKQHSETDPDSLETHFIAMPNKLELVCIFSY